LKLRGLQILCILDEGQRLGPLTNKQYPLGRTLGASNEPP
jgi:hypothetical protein